MEGKRAIIIGASSGIGRELAIILSRAGYTMGLAARRRDLLNELQQQLPGRAYVRTIDLACPQEAITNLEELITSLGGLDLLVISSGTGFLNPDLEWDLERDTVAVNVAGFTAMATTAMRSFIRQGAGHLVGISSLAALRGGAEAPAYNASKAYVSNYLEGLRQKAGRLKLPITITDIQPGFVDTPMAQGEGLFWVASPQKAAQQIFTAIQQRAPQAYVTRRWRLIAWVLKLLPDALYNRI